MKLYSLAILIFDLQGNTLNYQLINGYRTALDEESLHHDLLEDTKKKYPGYKIERIALCEVTSEDMMFCLGKADVRRVIN